MFEVVQLPLKSKRAVLHLSRKLFPSNQQFLLEWKATNKEKGSYWNSLSICISLLVSMCQRCKCLIHRSLIDFTCTHRLNYKDEKGAKHTSSFLLLQVLYLAKLALPNCFAETICSYSTLKDIKLLMRMETASV